MKIELTYKNGEEREQETIEDVTQFYYNFWDEGNLGIVQDDSKFLEIPITTIKSFSVSE